MITRGSVRRKSRELFQKVIILRKQGHSYTEIRKETGVAKSTINNWLTFAGLTLTKDHLLIQSRKLIENHVIATQASKVTRLKRKVAEIDRFLEIHKQFINEPFYNFGIALYESEGSKGTDCRLSNSDYRLIQTFVKFIEKYFLLKRENNMVFEIYIHDTRANDIEKIKGFWSRVIHISSDKMRIYWKRNKIMGRRDNPNYLGQLTVRVKGEKILGSKILAMSDIILKKYNRNYL